MISRGAALAGVAGLAACGRVGAYACAQDDDCAAAVRGGICETSGWCSFPDERCPSQRRYGQWVGDGLAQACVPEATNDTVGPDEVAALAQP